jgi:hypothetical protein
MQTQLPARFARNSSENAAHGIAVRWQADGAAKEEVFIPRRDTGSTINRLAGGRLFPGEHHRARFAVREGPNTIDLSMQSLDGEVAVTVRGTLADRIPSSSAFSSLGEASGFFEPGSVGYSVTRAPSRLDGLELRTHGWSVEALQVDEVDSSLFTPTAQGSRKEVSS